MPLVSKTPKEPKPLNFRDRYGVARIHCYAMFDTLNSVATETQQDPSLLRLRVAGSSRNNLVKAARRISIGNKIYNKLKANELLDDHWGGLTPTRFQKYFTSKPAPLAAKAKKKPAKNAKRQPRFIPEVAPFDVYRSLVMHYFPISLLEAAGLHLRSLEDAESFGSQSLVENIRDYHPSLGTVEGFLKIRIRRRIIDWARYDGFIKPHMYRQVKRMQAKRLELMQKNRKVPTDDQLMEALGVNARQFEKILKAELAVLESMDATDENDETFHDTIRSSKFADPFILAALNDDLEALKETVTGLNEQERKVLVLSHYEGFSQREIGDALKNPETGKGITTARVNQILTKINKINKKRMQKAKSEAEKRLQSHNNPPTKP